MKFNEKQLNALEALLLEDGARPSDDGLAEIARWLVARAESVARPIPSEKRETMDGIRRELQKARSTNVGRRV